MSEPDPHDARLQRCLELFAAHQRRLQLFISALLPSPADADEVLQETNIVIWKKFDQFDPDRPGSDFVAWALRIAGLKVQEYRRRQARLAASFSPEVLEQLIGAAQTQEPQLEDRRTALEHCLKKLPEDDRELLETCYAPGAKVEQVAVETSRVATSIYRSLRRIRRVLAECVNRQLAETF